MFLVYHVYHVGCGIYRDLSQRLTVEVRLEAAEGVGACEGCQPHAHAGAPVVVNEALHEHLLVGAARADLQPLQLQQLVEDAPLQVVPARRDGEVSRVLGLVRCVPMDLFPSLTYPSNKDPSA